MNTQRLAFQRPLAIILTIALWPLPPYSTAQIPTPLPRPTTPSATRDQIAPTTPALAAITPPSAAPGQSLTVAITGRATHFAQNQTTATFGTGVLVTSLTVQSPTQATAALAIQSTAIPGPRTVTVTTATESLQLNPGFTITTTAPPQAPAFTPIRVNAGGGPYLDPLGQLWSADTGFLGGNPFGTSSPIAATTTPALYQTERWNAGPLQYQFAVPPGLYNVKLKFAEIYFTQTGLRKFDINLNGTVVDPAFDPLAAAGASNTAIDRIYSLNASAGTINILLTPITSNPKISAIEIVPQAIDLALSPSVAFLTPNQTQQFAAQVAGTANTAVTWSATAGTISPSGLYTAPAAIPNPQTATITATSVADPTKSASSSVSLTPAWQTLDIGTPNAPGAYSSANGSHTVTGAGDINLQADAFRYVYQSLSGDGSITARYNPPPPCCQLPTKAGLMFRASTDPASAHAFLSIYSAIVGLFETRPATASPTSVTFGGAGVFWVKLTRAGNTFTGYIASEGNTWIQVGQPATIALPSTLLVGMAVSSGYTAPHTAIFDNVTISTPTTVSIDQSQVSLAAGQQTQFTATVLNNPNTAVNWSISPANQGAITPTGVYTAPASLVGTSTVTITATSAADPTKSSTAVVNLGQFVPIRTNAGGPSHIDPNFTFWNSDAAASAGTTYSNGSPIANTTTPYLYQSEHFHTGDFQYTYPVPNGAYNVKLKFAEIFFTQPGQRTFHVSINGQQVLTNFDVVQAAGAAFKAFDQTFPVTVTNGQIVIAFTKVISNPKISAIEITPQIGFFLTDFNPKTGPPGTLVTVTGNNFQPTPTTVPQIDMVKASGGILSAPVSNQTNTSFNFVVPPGATTGLFRVTVNGQITQTITPFTVTPSSDFTLTALPAAADLIQGQSVSYAVSLASTNNFTQLAALNVTGVPAGITAAFNPPNITAGQTSVLTLTAPNNQPITSPNLTVTASATVDSLPVTQNAPVTLNIRAVSTSFVGRTVVADTLQTPLAGVTVTMLGKDGAGKTTNCTGTTISDAAGNFALQNLSGFCVGPQLIGFDGLTAISPPGKYAGVNLVYTLVGSQVTASPVLVHLPRIDNQETFFVTQNSSADQTYNYTSIPGLSLTVYKNTTFTMPNGTQPNPFPLTAVQVPVNRLPDYKPTVPTMVSAFIVAFQPANAFTNQPVAVTYPNTLSYPPNLNMPVMTLDPTLGKMVPYGTATVSADGTQIIPDPDPNFSGHRYGIVHFDWHGPMGGPPNQNNPGPPGGGGGGPPPGGGNPPGGNNSGAGGPPPQPPDSSGCSCPTGGDPVDLSSGIQMVNVTDIAFSGGRGALSIIRSYRTLTNNPGPFGIGTNHNYGYALNTVSPQNAQVISLIMPDGNQYPFSKQPNGTLTNTSVPALLGAVMTILPDNSVSLRWKRGTTYRFVPTNFQLGSILVSSTDRNGNVTTITRDPSNPQRITSITDPVGRSLTFTYDASNRITQISDPIGRTVQYTYNAAGTLATFTDPEGNVTKYGYDAANRLMQLTDARNTVQFVNTFDNAGRVVTQTRPDGGKLTFTYTPLNPDAITTTSLETRITDERGGDIRYGFSSQGFVNDVRVGVGLRRVLEREPLTNKVKTISEAGSKQGYTYDTVGNVLTSTDPSGATTTFTYEPLFNQVTSIKDPLGNITQFTYDSRGNLLTQTDANGHTASFQYDQNGLLIQSTDALGQKTIFTYDPFGNRNTITDPLGHTKSFLYDGISRLTATHDALGRTTTFAYDLKGRLLSQTDARSGMTRFSYDAVGNLLSVTDARNNTTGFTYDLRNRMITRTDSLGRTDTRSYDTNGNLTKFVDRRGQTSTFTYNLENRLVGEKYQDANVSRSFDYLGRLSQVIDDAAGIFTYTYDSAGRLIRAASPFGTVSYAYDARGGMVSRQVTGQPTVSYSYDAVGNLAAASMPQASATFGYNARNQLAGISRLNGVSSTMTYDPAGQLLALSHMRGATILDTETYNYDAVGNRTSHSTAIGQPLITQAVAPANYDAANEQSQFGATTNSFDANGNLTSSVGPNGNTTYTWDSRNRLRAMISPTGTTTFGYDFTGALITFADTATSLKKYFVLDDLTNTVFVGASDGTTYSVLSGRGMDTHFATSASSGQVQYGLQDAINSSILTVDQNGTAGTQAFYEPYGQTTSTGSYQFQFTGRVLISPTLYYYRARFYSPAAGRFLSEDPLGFGGGDGNVYRYVRNGPLNLVDPAGLTGWYGDFSRWADQQANQLADDGHYWLAGAEFLASDLVRIGVAFSPLNAIEVATDPCKSASQKALEAALALFGWLGDYAEAAKGANSLFYLPWKGWGLSRSVMGQAAWGTYWAVKLGNNIQNLTDLYSKGSELINP